MVFLSLLSSAALASPLQLDTYAWSAFDVSGSAAGPVAFGGTASSTADGLTVQAATSCTPAGTGAQCTAQVRVTGSAGVVGATRTGGASVAIQGAAWAILTDGLANSPDGEQCTVDEEGVVLGILSDGLANSPCTNTCAVTLGFGDLARQLGTVASYSVTLSGDSFRIDATGPTGRTATRYVPR